MRVVIAEDQVLLRDGVARLLRDAGHAVVAEVGDARSLVTQVNTHRPDLVIADIRMPPSFTDDGARAVVCLRHRFPGLAAVMLSQTVDPTLARMISGIDLRSFGYLLEDRVLDIDEFLTQLEVVAGGGTAIEPGGRLVRARGQPADRADRTRGGGAGPARLGSEQRGDRG